MRTRVSALSVLASVAAFVVLELTAMSLYPGGTWWDPTTRGASFWQNYLCDLESEVALNHMPNVAGARFGKAAILVMIVGLMPFWWIVPPPQTAPSPVRQRTRRAAGAHRTFLPR